LDSRELQVIAPGKTNSDRLGGRGFVIAIFAALAAAPAAFAAYMPAPAPVHTKAPVLVANVWTGFYLGAGAGFRSANNVQGDSSAVKTARAARARDGYLVTADLLVYGTAGDAARQHVEATSTVGPFDEIRQLYQFRHRHQDEAWLHGRRRHRNHGLEPLARARRVPPL
jgi:hypothetical protein